MAAASREGQPWLPFVVFCAIGLLWLPALAGPFQFDDYNVIVGYAPVQSLAGWWQSLPGLRPLLKLSYALNWSVSPAPFGFHLVNLLLHLLNGALLLAWARRALPLDRTAALALVALWLLHPVQTEAVTYIAGRSVTLSATFLFAGLLLLARGGARAPAGAALCTALALAVRETAWVFPLVFALALWMQGQAARAVARAVAPSLLVVAVAAVLFLLEPHYRQMIDTSFGLREAGAQLRAQVVAQGYLLAQLVTLAPNIDPDLRVPAAWSPLLAAALAAWLAVMAGALAGVLRHRSWLAAGVLWFGLLLLPTNSLMPRVDLASERHLYAAWLGPLWCGVWLLRDWRWRAWPAALLLGLLATATLVRNEDYRSELALWARTAQQSPHKARVWNNLGVACREAGHRDCAEAAFTRALELDPVDPRAGANLYFLRHPRP
ncbi:MAG TPA: hypothetical protein VFV15_03260 [Moraxellaceae bacterium]|nr:hypothetical protein [Moraxellaceae bacterium]